MQVSGLVSKGIYGIAAGIIARFRITPAPGISLEKME
jgi:hypothetical protein